MTPRIVDPSLHTFRSPKLQSIVAEAISFLATTPVHPLPPQSPFEGVGVYILYYKGALDQYKSIASKNKKECTVPIYVGKAVPLGWRTARIGRLAVTKSLSGRLREHARSIASTNLLVEDFSCRFMIVDRIEIDLITAIEAHLVRQYQPLWNSVIDGFGNHDPGSGRYNQAKSEWDVLHPGRSWAERLTGRPPKLENILAKLKKIR